MNYPLDQIVIIAPIIFLVMMIAFPIIGVFGGWKRALYWGGGNFLFYSIGLVIWVFANQAMSGLVVGLIKGLIGQSSVDADFGKIAASVLAPIFFIGVVLISNLILLINYYAWFKKVAGLKKYKTVKKKDKNGNIVKTKVMTQQNISTKYKAMDMCVGGIAMGALMLPTTFAVSDALFFTTTSYLTRPKSGFASAIYDAIVGTDNHMSWFSYYSNVNESAKDYDALFAALAMKMEKITITLPDGTTVEESLIDALSDTLDKGLGDIYTQTAIDVGAGLDNVIDSVKKMIANWNAIINQAHLSMVALFNSANGTQVVCQILIGSQVLEDDDMMTHDKLVTRYTGEDAVFRKAVDLYLKDDPQDPTFPEKAIRIPVTKGAFTNMVDALVNLYEFKPGTCQEGDKEAFWECMSELLTMLFEVK